MTRDLRQPRSEESLISPGDHATLPPRGTIWRSRDRKGHAAGSSGLLACVCRRAGAVQCSLHALVRDQPEQSYDGVRHYRQC